MHSSRVENIGRSSPLWYNTIYTGESFPTEPSLVGAEVSDEVSESGSKVDSSVGFSLRVPGSEVGSAEGGSLGASRGLSLTPCRLVVASRPLFFRVAVLCVCDHGATILTGPLLPLMRRRDFW